MIIFTQYFYFHGVFSIVCCVQINYIKVPPAVKNDSNNPVILDCNYSVRPDDTDLVVKWYLNDDVVYQWIPPQKPQTLGPLKDRADLDYRATDDPKSVYRAIKIDNPTSDIAGEYKCFVSTFTDEDFSTKNMIVFVPERSLELVRSGSDGDIVNFTCLASEVYPTPKLVMYKDKTEEFNRLRLSIIQWDISKHSNGRISMFVVTSVLAANLDPGNMIHCELRIPGTGYVKIKSLLYYPEGWRFIDKKSHLLKDNDRTSRSIQEVTKCNAKLEQLPLIFRIERSRRTCKHQKMYLCCFLPANL